MTTPVQIKRVYEAPADSDGLRVLVDRLWPRGLSKASFQHDLWCKDLAPSADLRKWFGHQVERWAQFRRDYTAELQSDAAQRLMDDVLSSARGRSVTLLYGARDTEHNQAVVLAQVLQDRVRHRTGKTSP
ncbi:DUF488 domain-containing protein [Castellaniella sp.]|uniref:DUF488 domain-containing protein n=1 Tax=Castellaniella sp. TaxID=1955812 RepID=UPI002AFDD743|nr:DUF488 domain-containing protein [Castellaniella sp.]